MLFYRLGPDYYVIQVYMTNLPNEFPQGIGHSPLVG